MERVAREQQREDARARKAIPAPIPRESSSRAAAEVNGGSEKEAPARVRQERLEVTSCQMCTAARSGTRAMLGRARSEEMKREAVEMRLKTAIITSRDFVNGARIEWMGFKCLPAVSCAPGKSVLSSENPGNGRTVISDTSDDEDDEIMSMILCMCHDIDEREMCIESTLSIRIEHFPMDFCYPNLLQVLFPDVAQFQAHCARRNIQPNRRSVNVFAWIMPIRPWYAPYYERPSTFARTFQETPWDPGNSTNGWGWVTPTLERHGQQ